MILHINLSALRNRQCNILNLWCHRHLHITECQFVVFSATKCIFPYGLLYDLPFSWLYNHLKTMPILGVNTAILADSSKKLENTTAIPANSYPTMPVSTTLVEPTITEPTEKETLGRIAISHTCGN